MLTILASPQSSYASQSEELSWILGCWQKLETNHSIQEEWARASDLKFKGKAQEIKNGEVTFWEDLEIHFVDGEAFYQPAPMGKKSVLFKYQNRSEGTQRRVAAFINMEHDVPQQIIYSVGSAVPQQLKIELKGKGENGKPQEFEYSLEKTKCAGE